MKPIGLALLLLVLYGAQNTTQDYPAITVERAYGSPRNIQWREEYRGSVCTGWLGIMIRDSVSGSIVALRVRWPVPEYCFQSQRIGE